jgi:hypothetical protein
VQVSDRWQIGIFRECIERCSGDIEMDNLKWSISEHLRVRFQVEYPDAAAAPPGSMRVSTVDP